MNGEMKTLSKEKALILAFFYNKEDEKKLNPILDKMKEITSKVPEEVADIWKPYQGDLNKVYGILDDLVILNLTPEERQNPSELVQKILLKRCMEVQSFLIKMDSSTDIDVAYSLNSHITSCPICQDFVYKNFNIQGTRDLEQFIQKRTKGYK